MSDSHAQGREEASTAFMMGEIRSDVKHILASLSEVHKDQRALATRLDAVERFNARILGMAAVAVPALTLATDWLLAKWGA